MSHSELTTPQVRAVVASKPLPTVRDIEYSLFESPTILPPELRQRLEALHIQSWQRTTHDVFPKTWLIDTSEHGMPKMWAKSWEQLVKEGLARVFVAAQAGDVVGFAISKPNYHPTFGSGPDRGCYVANLHVRAGMQGKGVGKQLMIYLGKDGLELGQQKFYVRFFTIHGFAAVFYRKMWSEPDRIERFTERELFGYKNIDSTAFEWSARTIKGAVMQDQVAENLASSNGGRG